MQWVTQPIFTKNFFQPKEKSSFTFPNNQILKRKHILGPSERTNYLIDPKNEISTKQILKVLILTQNVNFLLSKKTFHILSWEKVSHALPKKKNISNEINYQNENDHANYNKVFFLILQYFFLYSTSLCFSFSESFLDCSWPYCLMFSGMLLLSFFVISRILLINPLTFLYM